MKLLVLMGGPNKNSTNNPYPLFLTEINGKILLENVLEKYVKVNFSDFIFCVKNEDIENFNIDSIIKSIIPSAKIISLHGNTKGAVCTALLATEYIENDEELLVVSVDDFIEKSISEIIEAYRKNNYEIGIATFNSIHPRYSFVRRDCENNICEFVEKKPVSREALASFYYFKKGNDFVSGARDVIRKDNLINNSFYISQILNEMILKQKKITSFQIANEDFHSFKSERQLISLIENLTKTEKN